MEVGCQPCVSAEKGPCGSNHPGQFACWCLALINAPLPRAYLLRHFAATDLGGMLAYCLLAVTAKAHDIPDAKRRPPNLGRLTTYVAGFPPSKARLRQEMLDCCENGTVPPGMMKFVETLGAPPGPVVRLAPGAAEGAPGAEGEEVGLAAGPDPAADGVGQADEGGDPQAGHVGDGPPAGSSRAGGAGPSTARSDEGKPSPRG
jgi:hypothetical protein